MSKVWTLLSRPGVSLSIVLICSLMWGLSFGLNYGVANQNTYLIHGLRMLNPELLTNDWLASQNTDYHPYFAYVAWGLYALNAGGWAFGIANVLAYVLAGLLIYRIITVLAPPDFRLPVFLIVIGVLRITGTTSVSGSTMFVSYLQPSTIASLGYLAAIYYFLKGRYWISGTTVAVTGIFHANYLLLAFPLFGLAHLLFDRGGLIKRGLAQFAVPMVGLCVLLPLILSVVDSPGAEAAREIFLNRAKPHHYEPLFFWKEFVPFAGWLLLGYFGYVVGWSVLSDQQARARLRALIIALLSLITIASLLTSVVYIPQVAQLYFWRLAPFQDLLMLLLAAVAVVHLLVTPSSRAKVSRAMLLVIATGLVFTSSILIRYNNYRFTAMAVVIAIIIFVFRRRRFQENASIGRVFGASLVVSLLAFLVGPATYLHKFFDGSTLISGFRPAEDNLYQWVRQTPLDTKFLIPPNMERFRLNAQRAVVVDMKSPPLVPVETLEWYDRIQLITGIYDPPNFETIAGGYNNIDRERLARVRQRYPFDYVVLRQGPDYDFLSEYRTVFANERFLVLEADPLSALDRQAAPQSRD